MPTSHIKKESQAFIIIGLPASGKSEITNLLSDKYGAIVLDSDYAKRKFPEYCLPYGASVVHDESSIVIFGDVKRFPDENSLLKVALKNEYNIVVPKIGSSKGKIDSLCQILMEAGYSVHLILVRLDRQKSVLRAISRYEKTKRYVPISMIFDTYSNEPTITFYDILNFNKSYASYTMISSDVSFGSPKEILYCTKNSPISKSDLQKCHKQGGTYHAQSQT